jgi:TolB-like protein/Tfp pilus assembly protein PilF
VPVITAVFSVLIVLVMVAGLGRLGGPAGESVVRTMAVLPLENLSQNPELEPFVDGMTEGLIRELAKIRSLRVIARDSVMRLKGAHKSAMEMARDLNAGALVEGSAVRSGDRVSLSLRLKVGAMDRVVWSQTYRRTVQEALELQSEAAKGIAKASQIALTPQEQAQLSPTRRVHPEAYAAYLNGRYQLYKYTVPGFQKALQYFKQAVELDPADASAWAGLADGYYGVSDLDLPPREAMPRAKAAVQRALGIDETLAEAHATLAMIQSQYDWDFAASERSFKRAFELNPSYAFGHRYYSYSLLNQGRFDEAIADATEAYRLDPLPPLMGTHLGWAYSIARRYDEAIEQFRKTIALDPDISVTHRSLGGAYVGKGMFEEAIAEYQKARVLDKACCLVDLTHVYAVSGQREQARRTFEELIAFSHKVRVDPCEIALAYVGLGDADKAFEWFEKAYHERSEFLLEIKSNAWLDRLHADPRYQSLLRRIGLPP